MELTEKAFQVLDTLDNQEIFTQRQLAKYAGVSLGQVNYILRSLLDKGLVKVGNFRNNPQKIGYMYLLTPEGIEAKSRLAVRFVMTKLREYNSLRRRLADGLKNIEKKGHGRIFFVGPPMVKEFVESIIPEENMKLILVGHCSNWRELKDLEYRSFDIALLFDGNSEGISKIARATGISHEKLITLW